MLLLGALHSSAQTPAKHRVLFNRFRVPEIGLFVADAAGKNEHALPHRESEYSPTLTPDGKWIVFTSERSGQSDIYRMHPDGSALEQLTDDAAFDDQGALSHDGKSLFYQAWNAPSYYLAPCHGNACMHLLPVVGRRLAPQESASIHGAAGIFRGSRQELAARLQKLLGK